MSTPETAGMRSLTTRLVLSIALLLVAGGALVTAAALANGRRAAERAYDSPLLGAARQIADSTRVQGNEVIADIPVSAFELLALAPEDRVIYRIVGSDGATLTGYDEFVAPQSGSNDIDWFDFDFRGEPARAVALTHRFAERAFSGTVTVLVGQTLRARTALARELAGSAIVVVALAGLCMTGLALFALHSALRPLRFIERSFVARDPHDLTPLAIPVPRELAPVVGAINRFMARIDAQLVKTDNLIADSAHQLRTPIAALQLQAELAIEERDPSAQHEALVRIHDRARRISRLTDQLLNRALVIHRTDSVIPTSLDVRTIAIDTAEEFDTDSRQRGQELQLDLPEEAMRVRGDELSLREACKNLVNNAFVHGRSPVVLSVRRQDDDIVLSVRDHGGGMDTAALARAGERYAGSGSSSVTATGLGLAIVQSVAGFHRGEIRFTKVAPHGIEVAMVLPAEGR